LLTYLYPRGSCCISLGEKLISLALTLDYCLEAYRNNVFSTGILMFHLIVVFTYLFILLGVGVHKSKKVNTQSDFAVAGRSLTPWVLVGTMLATWIGTGSILGNAGETYETGMAALILPLGGVLGILILTRVAGKVRAFEKITVPEILGERYGQSARLLSIIALVIAYMVIVSYQFNAGELCWKRY